MVEETCESDDADAADAAPEPSKRRRDADAATEAKSVTPASSEVAPAVLALPVVETAPVPYPIAITPAANYGASSSRTGVAANQDVSSKSE